jgi:hypothetical protein
MVYDTNRGEMVMFGGSRLSDNVLLDEVWEYDGAWHRVTIASGPAARRGSSLAYDEARHVVVMFAGRVSGSVPSNEIWEYDPSTAAWTRKMPAGGPVARRGACAAYDPRIAATVFFGGIGDSTNLADAWTWNGTAWASLTASTPAPPARRACALAFDATRSRLVLFGGTDAVSGNSAGGRGDTWVY